MLSIIILLGLKFVLEHLCDCQEPSDWAVVDPGIENVVTTVSFAASH